MAKNTYYGIVEDPSSNLQYSCKSQSRLYVPELEAEETEIPEAELTDLQ